MNITPGRALTRKDASDITHLLMACYHEGVLDAYRIQDDLYCQQTAEECRRTGSLGILETGVCKPSDFVTHLLIICRKYKLGAVGHDIVYNLPLESPILTLCMLMYFDGACSYVTSPDDDRIEPFCGEVSWLWPTLVKVDVRRFVVQRITELCVDMINVCREPAASRASMLSYELWLLTRPIGQTVKRKV